MRLAPFLVALVLLTGCGSNADNGAGSETPRYDITVVYWPNGQDGDSAEATLQCFPHGGTHPDPDGACAALDDNGDALEPVSGDVACTEIYGGDQVATITGSVEASFSRANGCEIDRWGRLSAVLVLEHA
jgi:Subtilisin inhibitor-like